MKKYKMSDVKIIGIMYFAKSLLLFLLSLDVYLGVTEGTNADVERHLEQGKKLLAAGQLAEALQHYHAAVDGDPSNYLTFFRRATVFLALGKSKSALPDLTKVIELKPDFIAARVQRGNVFLKQGKLDDAESDYRKVLETDPSHPDAGSKLLSLDSLREDIDEAYQMFEHRQYPSVVKVLEKPIETCPWDANLRELRAEAYIEIGDYSSAINDIRPTTTLISDNRKAYLKMSMLHYAMGDADSSLVQIRECLKLDPDDKQCYPHYKKVKKLVKQIDAVQSAKDEQRYDDCLSKANQILKIEPDQDAFQLRGKSFLCHCNAKNGNTQAAFDTCNDLLSRDPNDIHAMMDRGDTYISNEQWDEAIKDFQKVLDIDENNNRAKEGLKKAQKLLKQSQKRDYYRILGVKRNAKKKDILKAYRKLAAKWHPDKHEGDDKEKAEKKFIDIAAAKEVLTDPEKREKFDNGEDPLDPEAQQGGGGGGPFWHQGFNPFGNGGFQFKFHFN